VLSRRFTSTIASPCTFRVVGDAILADAAKASERGPERERAEDEPPEDLDKKKARELLRVTANPRTAMPLPCGECAPTTC
jgi:hypothetical protein